MPDDMQFLCNIHEENTTICSMQMISKYAPAFWQSHWWSRISCLPQMKCKEWKILPSSATAKLHI